jgi:hypothetical protein
MSLKLILIRLKGMRFLPGDQQGNYERKIRCESDP